ncbi:hypothetical protein [Erythrobacter sp. F6033]|uniref:hypothetical protein n=1 Tax=Erythrobacter sp. F6033 TaxID=2926401 RepID=UPI001FF49E32|nr:hypothetical protein [Erythrobacter sp. F6033]MCK0129679.1 hypothetical protein [Erythrobacter sp. F6033]
MKPKSIIMFDKLFWISMILGLLYLAYTWNSIFAELDTAEFGDDPMVRSILIGSLIVGLLFAYGISILLWYLTSRKANNVARWIYIVLTGLGVLMTIGGLFALPMDEVIISIGLSLLQIATVVYLLLPDAAAWFANKGKPDTDISTFE